MYFFVWGGGVWPRNERQKLLEDALEKDDNALLLELYRSSHEERARERRKAAAVEGATGKVLRTKSKISKE